MVFGADAGEGSFVCLFEADACVVGAAEGAGFGDVLTFAVGVDILDRISEMSCGVAGVCYRLLG